MDSSHIKTKLDNPNISTITKAVDESRLSTIEVKQTKSELNNNNITKLEDLSTINQGTTRYVEEMKKGTYNILVTVRCRPLNQKEKEINPKPTIKIMNRKIVILQDPNSNTNNYNLNNNTRSKEQTMAFDYVFDQNETQDQIFNSTTKFLLDGVVNGFNATVFAYGATGAGKTYTMLGNEDNPGIMPLTISELFNKINSYKDREYTVKLWYLEIYNENIKDLMSNSEEYLDLREDPNKGVIVSGITELTATSSEHILNILKKGNKNRTTEATNANETSSRSHAILQIMVSYKEKTSGIEYEIKYGKLSLIDLAGSERASATLNRGIRLIEGANINRSLLTLGNCINALCEANEKGTKPYVPYRDSKLTRLLKDSLGGNARTVMIANVSPFAGTFDDTYNTLKYANRAKNIKTTVHRNVLNAQYHITNYVNIIKNLQSKINELENQIGKRREYTTSPKIRRENNHNDSMSDENGFTRMVNELKGLCEETFQLKQKIVSEQITIFSMINEIKKDSHSPDEEEKKSKVKNMKKVWEKRIAKLKESNEQIDNYIKAKLFNGNLSNFQKEYINFIIKNHKGKIENLDLKFKLILIKSQSEKKDTFLSELENQIRIRDDIISNHKITFDDFDSESKAKYKTLSQLQKEYSFQFMISSSTSSSIPRKNSSSNELSMQLPPLSNVNNTSTINSVLSDVREMNNNLNQKLKNIQQRQNIKLSPKEKKKLARNYSNGLRNINSANTNNTPITNKKSVPKNILFNHNQGHNVSAIYSNIPSSAKPQRIRNVKQIKGKSGSQRGMFNHNINDKLSINKQGTLSEHNSVVDITEQSILTTNNNQKERMNHFAVERKITEEVDAHTASSYKQSVYDFGISGEESYPSIRTEQNKENKIDKDNIIINNNVNKSNIISNK